VKLKPNFFLTADTHFGHSKLLELQGRPRDVDEIIVIEWNKLISKKDSVLHLGDLALTNKMATKVLTDRLNGKKFLIRGNHDGHSETWFQDCGFTTVEPIFKRFKDKYENYISVLFTHEPVQDLPEDWFNIHGHLHGDDHRNIETTSRHFDVGVDVHNYKPIRLYDILKGFW
jgi:calcineurin-like phosphoesterase family protein